MSELSKTIRKYTFDYFYEHTHAPVLEEIMEQFHLSRDRAHSALNELEESHHVQLLPGTQRILMANPFSSITTPFRDTIRGKTYYTNCAWDTVSLHVMLGEDAIVESFCHHCAEPVTISLMEEKVETSKPADPVIYLSVPVSKWYDNLVNTCSNNMVYFSSKDHLYKWLAKHSTPHGEAQTVPKMIEVCRPLSKNRMDLNFERPSGAQLTEYWNSIGLQGEFWRV